MTLLKIGIFLLVTAFLLTLAAGAALFITARGPSADASQRLAATLAGSGSPLAHVFFSEAELENSLIYAAPHDADEQNLLRLRIVLQYLMRQAAQGALKRGCIRDLNSLHGFPSRRAQKCPAAAQRQGIRIHSKAADGCTDPLRLSFASLSVSLYRI